MLFWQSSYLYIELIFEPRHNSVLYMINLDIRQRPWEEMLASPLNKDYI